MDDKVQKEIDKVCTENETLKLENEQLRADSAYVKASCEMRIRLLDDEIQSLRERPPDRYVGYWINRLSSELKEMAEMVEEWLKSPCKKTSAGCEDCALCTCYEAGSAGEVVF